MGSQRVGHHTTEQLNNTIEDLLALKDTICRMNSQPIEGDKIFANHVSDKRFLSRVYKSPYNSTTKTTYIQSKNGQRA